MSSTIKPTDYSSRIVNLQVRPDALNVNDRIGITTSTEGGTQVGGATAKPVNLFDTSSYSSAGPKFTLSDGSTFQLPTMTSEESAKAQSVLSKIPEEHRDGVNQAASQLGQALFSYMVTPQSSDSTGAQATGGASKISATTAGSVKLASPAGAGQVTVSQASPDVAGVTSATQQAASSVKKSGLNYDDTVLTTAYAGVQGLQGQLTQYASYMQNTTKNQNTFRADANELQTAITDWSGDANATQNFTWHYVDDNGHVQSKSGDLTKSQAQDALDEVQAGVSSLGQDTQIQQIQLQQLTQNYQAGIETMSNVLKASYDTTKNTLGNIHY